MGRHHPRRRAQGASTGGPASCEREDGLAELEGADHTDRLPPPRLLGTFEPVLLGWTSRAEILGGDQTLVTSNGIFKPFALVDGVAVGSWGYAGGKVTLNRSARSASASPQALDCRRGGGRDSSSTARKGTT